MAPHVAAHEQAARRHPASGADSWRLFPHRFFQFVPQLEPTECIDEEVLFNHSIVNLHAEIQHLLPPRSEGISSNTKATSTMS